MTRGVARVPKTSGGLRKEPKGWFFNMRKMKIVADSSANLMAPDNAAFDAAAEKLKKMIGEELPRVQVKIGKNLGLCSYCAEEGGLLVGYEKF